MQLGFLLVEVGQVRKTNQMNIVGKNVLDVCVCTLTFYFCGFAFSQATGGGVIGEGEIF